ncbi:FeoA family protein [Achromobacter insuavis]|uniref:FeoA family protein n=1 Tax=Achromobacter insuavis TaxID=1287735 RepID=UPI001F13D7E3|nr:FeoA family protein [Achromobacter insuavis]
MIDHALRLCDLAPRDRAVIDHVAPQRPDDAIAARLRDLGFVSGEPVRLTARGPLGGGPLLVALGTTRFALRREEAARVIVTREVAHG